MVTRRRRIVVLVLVAGVLVATSACRRSEPATATTTAEFCNRVREARETAFSIATAGSQEEGRRLARTNAELVVEAIRAAPKAIEREAGVLVPIMSRALRDAGRDVPIFPGRVTDVEAERAEAARDRIEEYARAECGFPISTSEG